MNRGKNGKFVSENGFFNADLCEVWQGMKKRCYNHNAINYERYGGRGIRICDEWLYSLAKFCVWAIANGWRKGLQLDRINNDKGYCPENCKFSTAKEQANNRRSNVNVTYKGRTQTLKMWAAEIGIRYETLHKRITKLHWDIKTAFEKPTREHKEYKNTATEG